MKLRSIASIKFLAVCGLLLAAAAVAVIWGLLGQTAAAQTPAAASILTVTKTEDTLDGVCDADCSLREAITVAASGAMVVVPAGVYTLTLGAELLIDKDLTINGVSDAATIVQAGIVPDTVNHRVFNIESGHLSLSNVTVRHGRFNTCCDDDGGGIIVFGSLTLSNSTVTGNSAGYGGGIMNQHGGPVVIINSTISGNSAARGDGGGILNNGSMIIVSSTINDNMASFGGGGVDNDAGSLVIKNSIIANNGNSSGPSDCGGVITSEGNNLIGVDSGCDFTPAVSDLAGTSASPIDPMLGPLQDNGGPTFTHALLSGSPAIDAGSDSLFPAFDQRGWNRPYGEGSDIGAYEFPRAELFDDHPQGFPESYVTHQDTLLAVSAPGVLLNDRDDFLAPETMAAFLLISVSHGSLDFRHNGSFDYIPEAGFCGEDTFSYVVSDHIYPSWDLVSTTIEVRCEGLVANDDNYIVEQNASLTVPPPGVLANDVYSSGAVTAPVSGAAHGSVTLGPPGDFTYVPNLDFVGVDSFTYQLTDAATASNVATVSITVNPAGNNPPVVTNDTYMLNRCGLLEVAEPGVLVNDTDLDGDSLAAQWWFGPGHGDLVLGSDGAFSYQHDCGPDAVDHFLYRATDGATASGLAMVTLNINQAEFQIQGIVVLEGETDHSGAVVQFSGLPPVFTDAAGHFVVNAPPGNYDITVGKPTFLAAHKAGVAVGGPLTLPPLTLRGGDYNRDGAVDLQDLLLPSRNFGSQESPWD